MRRNHKRCCETKVRTNFCVNFILLIHLSSPLRRSSIVCCARINNIMHLLTFDMKNHRAKPTEKQVLRSGSAFIYYLRCCFFSVLYGIRSKANRPSWSLRQLQILHLWWLNLILAGSLQTHIFLLFRLLRGNKIRNEICSISFGSRCWNCIISLWGWLRC